MSSASLSLLAPAKLNLFLHITGRRDDGYHNLQTLFQLLNYGDLLEFTLTDPGVIALHTAEASRYPNVPMDNNLILQAVHKLQHLAPADAPGIDITLTKQIPMGAGLGGGSADAAITLLAVNALWELGLSRSELASIGLSLGADVPVFIHGHSAWAEGIGEQLQPVTIAPAWYVVVMPDCEVSTASIFSHENLTRNTSAIKMADFLAGRARNDCESVTCELYPEVENALSWLSQTAPAQMTGTGAAVFARFDSEAEAQKVFAKIPAHLQGFLAQGINSLEMDISDI